MSFPDLFIPPFIPLNAPYRIEFEITSKFGKKIENLAGIHFDWELTSDLEWGWRSLVTCN